MSFTYTIDDAKGNQSSAPVVVHARQPDENKKPVLRQGFEPEVHTVANQGRVSLPVLGDWRDPDGDPVVLSGASDGDRSVPVSADGRLQYVAPAASGARTVTYTVSDGRAASEGTQALEVLAPQLDGELGPHDLPRRRARADGLPIVIRPLDNDLPGTDPTTPSARLALAADVVAPGRRDDDHRPQGGRGHPRGRRPRHLPDDLHASYGDAPYARGTIRVDVTKRVSRTDKPTAMLDQAVVYGDNATIVDVLANDFDPSGRLLAVQSATTTEATDLQVAVIRGRWLRIQPTQARTSAPTRSGSATPSPTG